MKTYIPRPTGPWLVWSGESEAPGWGLLLDTGDTGWLLSGGNAHFQAGIGWMFSGRRIRRLMAATDAGHGRRWKQVRLGSQAAVRSETKSSDS